MIKIMQENDKDEDECRVFGRPVFMLAHDDFFF